MAELAGQFEADGQMQYVFHARIRQSEEGPFQIRIFVPKRDHVAELAPLAGSKTFRAAAV